MSQKKFTQFECYERTNIQPIFKAKTFILPSNANLDEKVLFGKITAVRNGRGVGA